MKKRGEGSVASNTGKKNSVYPKFDEGLEDAASPSRACQFKKGKRGGGKKLQMRSKPFSHAREEGKGGDGDCVSYFLGEREKGKGGGTPTLRLVFFSPRKRR